MPNDGISPKLDSYIERWFRQQVPAMKVPKNSPTTSINIHVSSDEPLQSAPRIAVVCSSLRWNEGGEMDSNGADVRRTTLAAEKTLATTWRTETARRTVNLSKLAVATKPRS